MRRLLSALAAGCLLAACQSTTPTETAAKEPDPRQGAEVRDICFASQIRGWREFDRDSIIVQRGVRDEFRLVLDRTCDPQNAFLNIALVSRFGTGNCLSRGDRLMTDDQLGHNPCLIRQIYEWREDAAKKPVSEGEASK